MGCDIHLIIEKKVEDRWVGTYATSVNGGKRMLEGEERFYRFFNKLAGVRGYNEKSGVPKGLPENLSDLSILLVNQWEKDGHSHSYCTAREFCELYRISYKEEYRDVENQTSFEILGIDADSNSLDDYRIVFFFDC